ncbi:MAG TPA: cysteine synthase family protein [Anaerolineae bacterium]
MRELGFPETEPCIELRTVEDPAGRPVALEDLVGNTPLLHLRRVAAAAGVRESVAVMAKAEWYNPSGSVKDRPALQIIRTAECEAKLAPGKVLLDATSGNMGIAYAMFGAQRGYHVRLALPANANRERMMILRAYRAELILTDPLEGADGAILEARRLAAEDPEGTYYADQYNNPANWQAHYLTTADEIWRQTDGRVTHFVAGLGTSGTFVGCTRRLKELNPAIRCVSLQPSGPFHGLEGLKHMASALRPGIYDESLADQGVTVETEAAYAMLNDLAQCEGLMVGVSAAAAVVAAIHVARGLRDGVVVTILPDSGLKYLSEGLWGR